MLSDFVLSKCCILNPSYNVTLTCRNKSLKLEIGNSGSVISYMHFPFTNSGLTFAKRVYNAFC